MYLLSCCPVEAVQHRLFSAVALLMLFIFAYPSFRFSVLTRMASGDGNRDILKALSQPLDATSLAEKVWETGNVNDSSKYIDFILHSGQLFDLLVKAIAPCAIYAAFNYFIGASDFHFLMLNHPQDGFSISGLESGCQLHSGCWIGYESWKALLKTWKTLLHKIAVMSALATSYKKWSLWK